MLNPRIKKVARESIMLRRVLSGISRTYSGMLRLLTRRPLIANYDTSTMRAINEDLDKITARKVHGFYTVISIRFRLMIV